MSRRGDAGARGTYTRAVNEALPPTAVALPPDTDPARLIARWRDGDGEALDALLPLIYSDLRQLAAAELRRRRGLDTLQPTALVNEVVLRWLTGGQVAFNDTAHVLRTSARMMRQILIDRSRRAHAAKRGGDWQRETLSRIVNLPLPENTALASLDAALEELQGLDERVAQVVELRYFIGLSVAEVAAVMDVDERTVYRDWAFARSWLRDRVGGPN